MRLRATTSAAAFFAALTALALVAGGSTAAPGKRVQVLGAAKPAKASCPAQCLVEARVTGFQTDIGRTKKPFRVPAHGRIVAWSVKLGRPVKADLKAFNREFGKPRARIAVLKPVKIRRKGKPTKIRYRLLRQGPVQDLGPFLGEVTTFGLPKALKARKGNVVALTIPSWAPVFSTGGDSRWRASRAPSDAHGGCTVDGGLANLEAGGAQDRKQTLRRYGCLYRGARLLYTVRLVAG